MDYTLFGVKRKARNGKARMKDENWGMVLEICAIPSHRNIKKKAKVVAA